MTRVVHVSSAHRWTDNRVHLREAASLAEAGYETHLVAVEHDATVPETGVQVHQLPARGRLARFLISVPQAFLMAIKIRPQIVHLHDPELILTIPLLRALGKSVVYDAHEDFPDQVRDKEYLPRGLVAVVVLFGLVLVRFAGRFASRIVAATDHIASRFPSEKVRVVRNFPRLRDEEESASPLPYRAKTCVYVGAMDARRGIDVMVRALESPSMPSGWELDLAGQVYPQSLLEELAASQGWAQVRFHGLVSPAKARDLLLSARVGLVVLKPTRAYVNSLPTKMFEYMAAGIPVIASDFDLWRTIVADNAAGLMVDESDPHAIAAAISTYAVDPELMAEHGWNGRQAVLSKYNWNVEARVLVHLYAELV